MDSDYLVTDLDFLAVNGVTFTTEERALLHNSLTLLKQEGKFRKVYFWGKLMGLVKSYYIAYGLHRDILRQKQTFYGQDMKRWNLLTSPTPMHRKLNKLVRKPLYGDPAYEETVKIPIYLHTTPSETEVEELGEGSVESDTLQEEDDDEEYMEEYEKRKKQRDSGDNRPLADATSADDMDFEDNEDVEDKRNTNTEQWLNYTTKDQPLAV